MASTLEVTPASSRPSYLPVLVGVGLATAGTFAIAFGSVLAAAAETGPIATAVWRFAIAGLAFAALAWITGGPRLDWRGIAGNGHLIVAALAFAATVALWYSGQRLSSVANAAVLHNLTPVILAAFGWFVLRQTTAPKVAFGLALAVCGAVLMVQESLGRKLDFAIGDGLALAGAFSYALYFGCIGRATAKAPFACVMCVVCWLGAAVLLPLAVVSGEVLLPTGGEGWLTVIGVAAAGSLIGQGLLVLSMRQLTVFQTSAAVLMEPVFATVLAAFLLAQMLTGAQALAATIALGGVAFCQLYAPRRA